MENKSHALLAGLFTLLFIAAAALAIWWFTGAREPTQTYWLETRGNLTGLNLEAQVRYRGIRAGKVRHIAPDPADPGLLLVEISLAQQYRITDKTTARLNLQGITGLAYVMLEESAPNGRPLDMAAVPQPRLTIQPGMIDSMAQQAERIAQQVGQLTERLNRLLDDRNLRQAAKTLDNLASAAEELPRLLAQMRAVFSGDNLQRLNGLLTHLEKTAGEAAPLTAEARSLLVQMNTLAGRFDQLARQAGHLGERFNGETLPRAEALLADVSATSRRLDRLIDALQEAPQAVLFGPPLAAPGPGEAGFSAAVMSSVSGGKDERTRTD